VKASSAFTMIEILIVVMLVGLMATMVMPRLFRRAPNTQWKNIADDVNNLIFFARQEAIANQGIYRVRFKRKSGQKTIAVVEQEQQNPEKPGTKIYVRAYSSYFNTQYEFADVISIDAVYLGKTNQMQENDGQAYCYVVPDGLVQPIIMHLTRKLKGKISKISLKMAPFLGTFKILEKHVKPEQ